ncbi:STE/STE7/MEK1 protein kinase [Mycena indigotica]|uniref:STE/STE7/MEK1 protein kinase n=1 Tax=Mycena indigotica TaxID=2126181 RepID=A0A8H6SHV5_9AGAR|nr:STE/STE7/MEK1 protein kinase [Mycena indigotica]KAF7298632.1 STE/STE7/MEK1 protein kinase [Mycena indigotica]
MSVRQKRNFRNLQLPVANRPLASNLEEPHPTRLAPLGPRAPTPHGHRPLHDGTNATAIDLTSPQADAASLSSRLAALDAKNTKKREFDLKNDDFTSLQELGSGNGGSVMKVQHVKSGTIMAKKVVLIDAKPAERKKILLELQIMHDCDSRFIVSSYGAYLAEPNICLCMEFMDKGSFDAIYKRIGPIDVKVVGKVAVAVLEGQRYLYDEHRIIHRDIKPSNILCNSQGEIKLCDFGVSGELINSIANTFVGTSIYMSPERIQGATYSVKSDIWSLGITLIELIVGQFPFSGSFDSDNDSDLEGEGHRTPPATHRVSLTIPSSPTSKRRSKRRSKGVSLHGGGMTLSIIELMHQIVHEPAPRLPSGKFGHDAEKFVDACLEKDGEKRTGLTGAIRNALDKGVTTERSGHDRMDENLLRR